ncbi:MAG: alpha/beta hydrolase [Thermodesulfobacteriota bacterium]
MKRMKKILVGTLITLALIYLALLIIAYLPYETTPIKELAGKESRFVKVNGHNIHYTKQGKGKPLILSHGFAGSTYTWRHLIPLLTDHYTVYAYDVLAFGLSDKPSDGLYDMKSQGDSLISLMDALKLPSAALVGHSMGGVIIGYAALAAPSRIDKMVLIEPGFYADTAPSFLKYMFFPLNRIMARQFYSRSMRKRFLLASFHNKSMLTEEVIDAYMIPTRTPNALDAMAHMMTSVAIKKHEGVSTKITRPTLIVWGERDKGVPHEDAKRLNSEIQGSKLATVKECGHYVQEEKPQELAKILRDFLG